MRGLQKAQPFGCTRREFLPVLLREAAVTLGMLRGGQGGRLSELGSLPDAELALIRPILNPTFTVVAEDGQVWARCGAAQQAVRLCSMEDKEQLLALRMFDGQHTLGTVGKRLAHEMGWNEAQGFAQAKALFLSWVSRLILVPRDPPHASE